LLYEAGILAIREKSKAEIGMFALIFQVLLAQNDFLKGKID